MKTAQLTTLAMLLGMAAGLNWIESVAFSTLAFPGMKLGLANSVTMIVLVLYGNGKATTLSVARVFLGALATGSFGSAAFLLSMSGAVISTQVMAAALFIGKKHLSLSGIGAIGGVTHNMGQLLMYVLLTRQFAIFGYGPKLIVFGSVAGFALGTAVQLLMNRLWITCSLLPFGYGKSKPSTL